MDNNENKSPGYESEPVVKDDSDQVLTFTDERPEITNSADTTNEVADVSEPMASQTQPSLHTQENYSYGGQINTQNYPYQGQYTNGGYYYSPQQPMPQQPPKKKGNRLLFAILCGILSFCLICGCVGIGVMFADNLKGIFSFDYSDPSDDPDDDGGINTSGGNQPNGGILPAGTSILYSGFDLVQLDTPGQKYPSLSDAYEATKDTVVSITVATAEGTSAGSGVIIGRLKDGKGYYVVTNNHVVEGAKAISIKLSNGTTYDAHTTYLTDTATDLAIIAIETTDTFKVAKIGKSTNVRVGEDIYVIGNPLGTLGGTLTNGIISAQAVKIFVADHYMTLIQTNAAINPGNSGGAMFNMSGELIGIVNAKYADVSVEGIGFAIPSDTAVDIVEQMIKQGYVTGRHVLGISVSYDTKGGQTGLWLTSIASDSALVKAGFQFSNSRYYMIESINGKTFTSIIDAIAYLDTLMAGDTAEFKITEYSVSGGFFGNSLIKEDTETINVQLVQKTAVVDIAN